MQDIRLTASMVSTLLSQPQTFTANDLPGIIRAAHKIASSVPTTETAPAVVEGFVEHVGALPYIPLASNDDDDEPAELTGPRMSWVEAMAASRARLSV